MIRKACLTAFVVALAFGSLFWAGPVSGVAGGKADPANDVYVDQTQGPGHLDIVKVSHRDDGKRVTYTVRTAHQWATTDLEQVYLNIDHLDGVPQHDCQQITAIVLQKSGKLSGYVHECFGSGSGPEGGPGGSKHLGPVTATHAENTDSITFSFDLSLLRDAGFEGNSYRYNVMMEQNIDPQTYDIAPGSGEWIEHVFSSPATPEPTVAAVVTPEATLTSSPTPEPTPLPTVEPTPVATDGGAMSFSAPEEHADDSNTQSTPLRAAAAGSVVAGAGVALVRFWPF